MTPNLPTQSHLLFGAIDRYALIASFCVLFPITNSAKSNGNPISKEKIINKRKKAPPPLTPVT